MHEQENIAKNYSYILIADDDPDDWVLFRKAKELSGSTLDLVFVNDGKELADFLFDRGRYADCPLSRMPLRIVVNLHTQRKNSRQALAEIKEKTGFKNMDITILAAPDSQSDLSYCTSLGITKCISKPFSAALFTDLMK